MADTEATVLDREPAQFIEEGPTLPALLTDDFVKQFEKGVEVYKRWVSVCYRLTRESHWMNHGTPDKPRYALQGPGAEALMNPLGISFERPNVYREDQKDDQGEYYLYWCEGYMESRTLGRRGWYIGYCDSRDQFFVARPGWNPKTGQGDVKKSAMTNWIVNGVTRIAGIRDPDPKSLAAAGLDANLIGKVDYSGRRSPEQDVTLISEAQRKRLWAICKSHNVAEDAVKTKFGLASFSDVKRGEYERICKWAEDGGKNGPPESPAGPAETATPSPSAASVAPVGDLSPSPGEPTPTEKLFVRIQEYLDAGKVSQAALTKYLHTNFCDKAHKEPVCDDVKKLNLLQLQAVSAWLTMM